MLISRLRSVFFAGLALVGCTGSQGLPADAPSVLLVTLSSVRADHVGVYGADRAETPNLDRLAEDGTVFLRAYSPAPATLPAIASVHTGLYPPGHGVRLDGDAALSQSLATLAERFQTAGYATLAVGGSFLDDPRWGLDQGFDRYATPATMDFQGADNNGDANFDDDTVVDEAISLLADSRAPVFVWVHLDDVHAPHEPSVACRRAHRGLPYDAEIACEDAALGRLLDAWEGVSEDSVVLVTSDHGESLGEAGESGHGLLLTDAALRVPLILRGRGSARVGEGEREDDPVSLVDIAPTLLAIADLPELEGLPGRDLRDGGSKQIYSESSLGSAAFGLAPLSALTLPEGRLVVGAWTGWYPARKLKISNDMDPQMDVSDLVDDLGVLRASFSERMGDEVCLDGPSLDRLMKAGGLPAAPQDPLDAADPRDLPGLVQIFDDARGHVAGQRLWAADRALKQLEAGASDAWASDLLRARMLRSRGRLDEAASLYAALYEVTPSATLALQVADAHESAGRVELSWLWYRNAFTLSPDCGEATAGMAHAALAMGRRTEAEEILASGPEENPAMMLVEAELLLADGRAYDALEAARAAGLGLSGSAGALAIEGAAWWALGDLDEAVSRYERALDQDRYNVPVRMRLAGALRELGRSTEAARLELPTGLSARGDAALPAALRDTLPPG